MMRSTKLFLFLFAVVSPGSRARGQESGSACAAAVAHAKTIVPPSSRGRSDDIDRLSSCGRDGVAAVGVVFRNARTSRDTAFLGQLISYATGQDGLMLLEPLLTVAEDRQASTEARIVSMVGLLNLQTERSDIRYYDLTGGLDETGSPTHGCGFARTSTDREHRSRPTPAEAARITALAKRIRSDATAAKDLQSAAACLGG
jgi:hypothetical protein